MTKGTQTRINNIVNVVTCSMLSLTISVFIPKICAYTNIKIRFIGSWINIIVNELIPSHSITLHLLIPFERIRVAVERVRANKKK